MGEAKHVLDVGSGPGHIAAELRKNKCEVVCIERNPRSIELARCNCYSVIESDLHTLNDLPYPKRYFDVIVYADVLEHLLCPQEVMGKLGPYLRDHGGYIIVSIPNIAQLWVRLSLLFGRFEYNEGGILDKTHLKFYTYASARRLLGNAGYRVSHVDYAIHPFWPRWIAPLIYFLTGVFPRLLAVQFVFKAEPDDVVRK